MTKRQLKCHALIVIFFVYLKLNFEKPKKYKPEIQLNNFDKLQKLKIIPEGNDPLYERFKESQKKGHLIRQKYLSEMGYKREKVEIHSKKFEKIQHTKEKDKLKQLDKPIQLIKKKFLLKEPLQTINSSFNFFMFLEKLGPINLSIKPIAILWIISISLSLFSNQS